MSLRQTLSTLSLSGMVSEYQRRGRIPSIASGEQLTFGWYLVVGDAGRGCRYQQSDTQVVGIPKCDQQEASTPPALTWPPPNAILLIQREQPQHLLQHRILDAPQPLIIGIFALGCCRAPPWCAGTPAAAALLATGCRGPPCCPLLSPDGFLLRPGNCSSRGPSPTSWGLLGSSTRRSDSGLFVAHRRFRCSLF